MGIRSSYWKTRLALTGPESVETLTAMEGFFRGGAKWIQGVYHAATGENASSAQPIICGRHPSIAPNSGWSGPLPKRQVAPSPASKTLTNSRRSYGEIAEVLARARQLAAAHDAQQAPARPALTYQPEDEQRPVVKVTMADLERVALLSRPQRKPSNHHD